MTIMDSLKRMAGQFGGGQSLTKPVHRTMSDDETTDQHLRFLRRENRRINEGYEKKYLVDRIHREHRKQNFKMLETPRNETLIKQKNLFPDKYVFRGIK